MRFRSLGNVVRVCMLALAGLTLTATGRALAAETVVEIATRPGISVRALVDKPAKPIGSVILLAGGHGNLNLSGDGKIGWGKNNQLVRSRGAYAAAGYVTLVPDIAPDLKRGKEARGDYRWSGEHAEDIGVLVRHLRTIAQPVYLVGTSRGALSVTNAAARLKGGERPEAIVITSGMIAAVNAKKPFAENKVGRLERITQPVLLVYHKNDGCKHTPAASAPRAKALLKGAKLVDVSILSGGEAGSGDPCKANSHHGFLGQDKDLVDLVTGWLGAHGRP